MWRRVGVVLLPTGCLIAGVGGANCGDETPASIIGVWLK